MKKALLSLFFIALWSFIPVSFIMILYIIQSHKLEDNAIVVILFIVVYTVCAIFSICHYLNDKLPSSISDIVKECVTSNTELPSIVERILQEYPRVSVYVSLEDMDYIQLYITDITKKDCVRLLYNISLEILSGDVLYSMNPYSGINIQHNVLDITYMGKK